MTELREKLNNIVEDYNACKVLAESVGNPSVYEGTTATAEDILAGKTAYSNGEKITGIMKMSENNSEIETKIGIGIQPPSIWMSNILKLIRKIPDKMTIDGDYAYAMFSYCEKLESVPLFNTSSVVDMGYMFNYCKALTTVPQYNTIYVKDMRGMFSDCTSLIEIPLFNTSRVENMTTMFIRCTNLQHIPLLNTSKVTQMTNAFSGCTNLTEESLNNILTMCVNSVITPTSNKTLKKIGLTSTQATKCQTLPNYQAFLDAGWTTGY